MSLLPLDGGHLRQGQALANGLGHEVPVGAGSRLEVSRGPRSLHLVESGQPGRGGRRQGITRRHEANGGDAGGRQQAEGDRGGGTRGVVAGGQAWHDELSRPGEAEPQFKKGDIPRFQLPTAVWIWLASLSKAFL